VKQVKKSFPDISPRAWEHPADTAALTALKRIPGLDEILKRILTVTTDKSLRLIALGSAVRVTERQFPRLHRLREEACMLLDLREPPELFVSQSPFLNAGAIGVNHPFIGLNSALIGQLEDEELLAVIAHELGHILSGHVLYKTLLYILLRVSTEIVPVGKLVLAGVIAALKEWDRRSEMSADRAGLLVTQDPQVSFTVLMKVAGGSYPQEMSLDEFLNQAAEYEKGGDVIDSVHKLLNLIDESHPFAVLRLAELKSWHDSGAYAKILSGNFPRRSDGEDLRATFERAAGSYREELERSQDPLASALRDIGKRMESTGREVGKQAEDLFKGLFGGGFPPGAGAGPSGPDGQTGPGKGPQPGTAEPEDPDGPERRDDATRSESDSDRGSDSQSS